jgi:chemotaxis protein methyltransferase CheR
MVKLGVEEWRPLAQYIQSICGIQLDESKQYLIEGRLGPLLAQWRLPSFTALCNQARAEPGRALERGIVDAITTGETSFFRDGAPFDLVRMKLGPDLIERRKQAAAGKIPLRVWSAACSTGQEVYSLAIILHQLTGGSDRFDVRLFGTDISPEAVQRAAQGVYNRFEAERGIPAPVLQRYFTPLSDGWKVREEIRAMASFRTLNLMKDFSFLGCFDLIFCRNVAIYFSESDRKSLFSRIADHLAQDGSLIIGATESLLGMSHRFRARQASRAVYYQRA